MNKRLESLVSFALVMSAIVIAAVLVHREFFASAPRLAATRGARPTVYDSTWRQLLPDGVTVGDSAARIQIVEFTDLECPFCARMNSTLRQLRRDRPKDVAVTIVHLPLEMHRFARPAARVAECAGEQNRFQEMVDVLFAKQDSLGLKSWISYAKEASVPDTATFTRCAAATSPIARIERGVVQGKRFHVESTPTILINGWRVGFPSDSVVVSTVNTLMAGKVPSAAQ